MSHYPIELIISFDDNWVTITHRDPPAVSGYPIEELGGDKIDALLGADVDYVVYSQGEEYTKEDYEALFGKQDLANMIRIHDDSFD